MKKTLLFAWFFIILGGIISIYFIFSTILAGFWIWGKADTNFTISAQFGDFIGGVTGTLFALAGTLMIFLTFKEQSKQKLQTYYLKWNLKNIIMDTSTA